MQSYEGVQEKCRHSSARSRHRHERRWVGSFTLLPTSPPRKESHVHIGLTVGLGVVAKRISLCFPGIEPRY